MRKVRNDPPVHVTQTEEGAEPRDCPRVLCLINSSSVAVVDMKLSWFDGVSQVFDGFCEPLAFLKFE